MGGLIIDRKVNIKEVVAIIQQARLQKALRLDNILMGFLKAYGEPFYKTIIKFTDVSFRLEYFPKRFRRANVIVLRKPGKIVE